MANESSNNNGTNSPVVSLFQKAHQRMVMLGRMDEQLASLFDQRKKLFEELRDIQYSERLGWGVQLTKTFALGENADLTLDFQLPNLRGRTESFETVRNAAGNLTLYREQIGQPNNIGVQGSGVLKWRPTAQDTVSFNAQVAPTWNTTNLASFSYTPAGNFAQGMDGLRASA